MSERKSSNFFEIILFSYFGIFFLISSVFGFGIWYYLWPFAVLITGILFEISYFIKTKPWKLYMMIPGTILIATGIIFIICVFNGYHSILYLWPFFPLSVTLSFLLVYFFNKKKIFLIFGLIITGASLLKIPYFNILSTIIGIIFILLGIYSFLKKQ